MVILGENSVRYLNNLGMWVLATQGEDIPQKVYDALSPWERYLVLAHFADQGDEPIRY